MDFNEISMLAFQNTPLPKVIGLLERSTYLGLRSLYRDYLNKTIPKEQAAKEKMLLKMEFEKAKMQEQDQMKLFHRIDYIRICLAKVRPLKNLVIVRLVKWFRIF